MWSVPAPRWSSRPNKREEAPGVGVGWGRGRKEKEGRRCREAGEGRKEERKEGRKRKGRKKVKKEFTGKSGVTLSCSMHLKFYLDHERLSLRWGMGGERLPITSSVPLVSAPWLHSHYDQCHPCFPTMADCIPSNHKPSLVWSGVCHNSNVHSNEYL